MTKFIPTKRALPRIIWSGQSLSCYNFFAMKNNNTSNHFTAEQGILPMFPSEILNVDDPVLMYDRFMEEIDLKKYLRYIPTRGAGRPRYNPVNMLKTITDVFRRRRILLF